MFKAYCLYTPENVDDTYECVKTCERAYCSVRGVDSHDLVAFICYEDGVPGHNALEPQILIDTTDWTKSSVLGWKAILEKKI